MSWLINKVAADMDMTTEQLETNDRMVAVVQKYIVGDIETYAELLKSLYQVKGKKSV
jgi:hypothetical protein